MQLAGLLLNLAEIGAPRFTPLEPTSLL